MTVERQHGDICNSSPDGRHHCALGHADAQVIPAATPGHIGVDFVVACRFCRRGATAYAELDEGDDLPERDAWRAPEDCHATADGRHQLGMARAAVAVVNRSAAVVEVQVKCAACGRAGAARRLIGSAQVEWEAAVPDGHIPMCERVGRA